MPVDRAFFQPRIAPVGPDEEAGLPETTRAVLSERTRGSGLTETPQIYGALARHPALFDRLLGARLGRMPDALLSTTHRELLILRTVRRCDAHYEWVHHVRQAKNNGLTTALVQLARDGATVTSSPEGALVAAADELFDTVDLSDTAWEALAAHFDDAQIIEVLVLVGYYRIFAHLGNACRLPLEDAVAAHVLTPWPTTIGEGGAA